MMNHILGGARIAFMLPEADGSDMDAGDERAHMMGLYGGIAFAAPSAALVAPGLEYAARPGLAHYAAPGAPVHFAAPVSRLHYAPPDEDN